MVEYVASSFYDVFISERMWDTNFSYGNENEGLLRDHRHSHTLWKWCWTMDNCGPSLSAIFTSDFERLDPWCRLHQRTRDLLAMVGFPVYLVCRNDLASIITIGYNWGCLIRKETVWRLLKEYASCQCQVLSTIAGLSSVNLLKDRHNFWQL